MQQVVIAFVDLQYRYQYEYIWKLSEAVLRNVLWIETTGLAHPVQIISLSTALTEEGNTRSLASGEFETSMMMEI